MNRQGTFENYQITALGHAGFLIENTETGLRLAFDPFDIEDQDPVDYIFVSHAHYDHCDPNSIKKIIKDSTKIIAPQSCASELAELSNHLELLSDKEKHSLSDITYWAIPAYNVNKFRTPSEVFHPQELGGVGFVVEIGKTRFYHAGDTDFIPEMEMLKKISVAFLPISGTFVMTLEEAIRAAELIAPKLAIPMHYGKLLGSVTDAVRFQNLLKDKVPTLILTTSVD